ncbi:MAG: hypothetical protein VXU46_01540 [Planctomycetota bacterium]|nr:hypothetical protein [Planctomycetota bacterium]
MNVGEIVAIGFGGLVALIILVPLGIMIKSECCDRSGRRLLGQ